MEMGKPPLQAALDGSREIGFTILSMTLSLVAVFIPVLLMGGLLGRLFHEFAVVISAAILMSGFVSLTLTPMLCSRFLRPEHAAGHGRAYTAIEDGYLAMLRFYQRTLDWVMDHRGLTMWVSLGLLLGTVALFRLSPKGFIPSEDTGLLNCTTEAAEGTSFEAMVRYQRAVEAVIAKDPNIQEFQSTAGGGGGGSSNTGRLFIRLKPRSQRKLSADEVVRELQPKLARIPGVRAYLLNPPVINVGGRMSRSQYQFTLQSTDIPTLYQGATDLLARLQDAPELQDVTSDLQIKNPQVRVDIDRERAAAMGVTAAQIEEALQYAYGSGQVSTILTSNDQYWVIMELQPRYQRDASALSLLTVRSSQGGSAGAGAQVPLGAVAKLSTGVGPLTVNHQGQIPAVTVSFNLRPGVSLGEGTAVVQRTAHDVLPSTISTGFFGTAQVFQSSQQGLLALLFLAILVIYLVLGVLYESFIHPLTILSGLPFAAFGALLTLLIFRTELTIYAYVGIILLIGLVKKNAIMMIDFALDAERNEGKPAPAAIVEACHVRFRPIMMTTFAALMGTLPIAIGFGAGAESRRPLGLAVVGGLAFSQIITLYVTPVIYTYLDAFQRRLRGARAAAPAPDAS